MIQKDTLENIALLARLNFSESEAESFREQMGQILDHIEQLNSLDTSGIEATFSTVESGTPMREDVVEASPVYQHVLEHAPAHEDSFFVVPKVL